MEKIKKGDIVGRKSYHKDILFIVDRIIKISNGKAIAMLKGLNIRIQADSDIDDLELIDKKVIEESERKLDKRFEARLQKYEFQSEKIGYFKRSNKIIYTGKILHLDGDSSIVENNQSAY